VEKKCTVLIPAYEPEETMIALLKELRETTDWSVVIVDDGSGPDFAPLFETARQYALVTGYTENHGKGYALRRGMVYIKQYLPDTEIILTMDADGQHKVPDAVRVVKKSAALGRSLVIGSRAFTGKIPLRSRFGNGMTRFVYTLATGSRVTDTQTGLRAFHMDSLDYMLTIPGDRYEYEMTMLLQCPGDGIPIVEVPIETVYLNENKSSHFNALKDSARIYKDILKFCGSSLLSFLVDFLLFNLLAYLLRDRANGIVISNVIARVISATFNYVLNKRVVFQKKGDVGKTAVQYFALAVGILIANTAIVTLLYEHVVHVKWVAKLIAEVVLFVVNWCVQRFIIFKKTEEADGQ
jgi:putative flippase GtrA